MNNYNEISAVILSAGKSERMGSPKALLKIGNTDFINMLVNNIRAAGLEDINIVLGAEHSLIAGCLNSRDLNIIINQRWEDGQLSSLKTALRFIRGKSSAAVFLIDHPFVKISTIKLLADDFLKNDCDVLIPEYGSRGGHPVFYRARIYKKLMDLPEDRGARALYEDESVAVQRLATDDSNILQDIDTYEDYIRIIK